METAAFIFFFHFQVEEARSASSGGVSGSGSSSSSSCSSSSGSSGSGSGISLRQPCSGEPVAGNYATAMASERETENMESAISAAETPEMTPAEAEDGTTLEEVAVSETEILVVVTDGVETAVAGAAAAAPAPAERPSDAAAAVSTDARNDAFIVMGGVSTMIGGTSTSSRTAVERVTRAGSAVSAAPPRIVAPAARNFEGHLGDTNSNGVLPVSRSAGGRNGHRGKRQKTDNRDLCSSDSSDDAEACPECSETRWHSSKCTKRGRSGF